MLGLAKGLRSTEQLDEAGNLMPFSITFCTLDRRRRTGGDIKTLENVVRCGQAHSMNRRGTIGVQPADGSGHPTAIHIHLIKSINGEELF